jgi:hypothetical protein
MTAPLSYASSFDLKKVTIKSVDGGQTLDITNLIIRFDYFENINLPTISGNLDIVDSGANIIATLPIQGYEDVEITLETIDKKQHEYKFKVYRVYNRFSGDRFQKYSLGLISEEALLNESVKVPKTLKGKADGIVRSLLTEHLGTKKKIETESAAFDIIFHPGKKTPFSIVETVKMKTVAQKASNKATPVESSTPTGPATADETESRGKMSGSAGYLFFENKDGYHFKSIDRLNSRKDNPPVAVYTQENAQIGGPAPSKIVDIDFEQEIDLLTKLRTGAFSSVICFYNYSTGAYEEFEYKLDESFKEMQHLGSQTGLLKGQKLLSNKPTRVMSVLIDHETWFSGTEVASPEKRDGGKGKAEFPDFQKYYMSQSIARLNSLNNQQVKIEVPSNPSLRVGQTVEIRIPNQIQTSERKKEVYDTEHSGVYLIAELNHAFDPKKAQANTFLTLIRDSYGKPDELSKAKT